LVISISFALTISISLRIAANKNNSKMGEAQRAFRCVLPVDREIVYFFINLVEAEIH
jgi:hypothetical protein